MSRLIPRRILFDDPERSSPRLSPDGTRLAYLAPDEGVLNVWVRTVGRDDDRPVTRDRGRGIHAYFWACNDEQLLYVQDTGGDENWHLFAVGVEGGSPRDLTPFEEIQAQVLAVEHEFPDEILVALNQRDPVWHDVVRVNTRTGERTIAAENTFGATGWHADRRLRVRAAEQAQADGSFKLLVRDTEDADWREVLTWGGEDTLGTTCLGFTEDASGLWIATSIGSDTTQLRRLDLESGEQTVIAADDAYDLGFTLFHPVSHRLQAVSFVKERESWQVIDPDIAADFEQLAGHEDGDFQVVNRDRADATWLVAYDRDAGSASYHAYDRVAKTFTLLFKTRPELDREPLQPMEPVTIRARDGLILHGYLTRPPGSVSGPVPAILDVHGGPWHRDTWGFNPEVQWLANRGYAVLQVNFRGSTGYGKRFVNAGDKEWGGAMQDDITDSARWLIAEGIADPDRIGIYGGSYGGFAVLSGLTGTPELFACGVDIVGPSSLFTWMETIPPYWKPYEALLHQRVGHPERDRELLEARSPLFHLDRIRAPLFIAQGKNDPRVRQAESLQIVAALREQGKKVEYLEFEDEGHGFVRPENRHIFYARAEAFLARHLGGRCEPEAAP